MGTDDIKKDLLQSEIVRLHFIEGMSARAIARKLSVSRNTVRQQLGRAPAPEQRPSPRRGSILEPYKPELKCLVEEAPNMKAPAALERLRAEGYTGGITLVRDHLRLIRPRPRREAFLTLDFQPGAAMQVDWGDFGYAIPGCPRRVSALVIALCYSRHLYIEFTLSQTFGTFVRAMERGMQFFGGTTVVDIFDNMKTVVLSRHQSVVRFNPKFLEYATARGFGVRACNAYSGNEKGRVERPIGFMRERFWPGRRFTSLLDLNQQATAWRDDFANNREHEVTGKIPSLTFNHEEKSILRPLAMPLTCETDDIVSGGVTKMFRVRFDKNRYSVPPRLVAQNVVIRANDDVVGVYLGPKQVALHRRCWGIGEDIEHPSHRSALLEIKKRGSAFALPPALAELGDTGIKYFRIFGAGRRSLRREIVRLTLLCELFSEEATADAMKEVMETGHVGAEYVEYVLRHKRKIEPSPPPLLLGDPELDALNFSAPDLSVYDHMHPADKTLDPGDPPGKQQKVGSDET